MTETVEVETGPDPVGSVIWLHGLGADGHDFEPVVGQLGLPESMPLRFVFPHAPVRPVTINGGVEMRAWYDIRSFDAEGRADHDGVRDSSRILDALIDREIDRGIPADRIVVAGFSQGGAIAVHNVLRTERAPAGLMALSTYLPVLLTDEEEAAAKAGAASVTVPVFAAHGTFDPMVRYQWGRDSASLLESLGYAVEWHEYPMLHGVCPQEIADISDWLQRVFSP